MLTETPPPLPDPNVLLEISALLNIDKVPAPTLMLPAVPGPEVLVTITPPFEIDRVAAFTITVPALPVLPEFASENIPVGCVVFPIPSIDSAPATVTETSPPFPAPNVVLEMAPLLRMDKVPARTLTFSGGATAAGVISLRKDTSGAAIRE